MTTNSIWGELWGDIWGNDGIHIVIGDPMNLPFDEIYQTKEDYKDTWGVMNLNQYVVFSNPTEYVDEGDVFWNPWNQDPTFAFKVTANECMTTYYMSRGSYNLLCHIT